MSDATEIAYLPATELAARVRDRTLSPVEIVDALLARIESDAARKINPFAVVLAEQARAEAYAAEQAVSADPKLGPLHGVPFAIKDLTPMRDIPISYGSRAFRENIGDEDAPVVVRLKAAGGICIAKTTTPEFGSKGTTESPLTGVTANPWSLDRTSGGSSGGSAAAVAAGLVPIAQGSDGGGSVRIPASCCGIVGLKPTYGRIPYRPEDSVYETLTHLGPMARNVRDAALMLDAMVGPDAQDPFSLPTTGSYVDALDSLSEGAARVAFSPDLGGIAPVEPEVAAAVAAAGDLFASDLGATVREVELDLGECEEAMLAMWRTSIGYAAEDILLPRIGREELDPAVLALHDAAQNVSAIDYYRAAVVFRNDLYLTFARLFDDHDLLITPVMGCTAFSHVDWHPGPERVNGVEVDRRIGWIFTYPFNMTGLPAISVPCGFSKDGLPIGLQIVGPRLADDRVLQAAMAYEAATAWSDRHPDL